MAESADVTDRAGLAASPDVTEVAGAVRVSVGLLVRRLRQIRAQGDLSLPESSALARLDRGGAASSSDLARLEQISPQSMGATLAALEARGLAGRRADPQDGRRVVISITESGRQVLRDRRDRRTQLIAQALTAGFSQAERDQLMAAAPLLERLARQI